MVRVVELEKRVLEANEVLARAVRELLDSTGTLGIEVLGGPGAGKTSIIEQIALRVKDKLRLLYIAGDVATTIDAERLERLGVTSLQINTGRACHLEAAQVLKALNEVNLEKFDVVFVENVGNLICPADFPLGMHERLLVLSASEGEDKARKHPFIVMAADVVAVNKVDVARAAGVNVDALVRDIRALNPRARIVLTSAKTGEGIEELVKVLELPVPH